MLGRSRAGTRQQQDRSEEGKGVLTQLLNERTRTARFSRRNLEFAGGVEKEVVLVGDAAENPAARQQAGRS
jgi:hypothetical protein